MVPEGSLINAVRNMFKNKKLFPPLSGCDKRKIITTGLLLLAAGGWAEPEIRTLNQYWVIQI
jgi:hypothetical protein